MAVACSRADRCVFGGRTESERPAPPLDTHILATEAFLRRVAKLGRRPGLLEAAPARREAGCAIDEQERRPRVRHRAEPLALNKILHAEGTAFSLERERNRSGPRG